MAKRKVESEVPASKVELTIPPEFIASVKELTLDARVAALELTMSALIFSTFGARSADGKMLSRCHCGCFATRKVTIEHRVAGMHSELLCDDCSPRSPLATKEVPQREAPILEPGDLATVTRVNRGLNQARLWGGS